MVANGSRLYFSADKLKLTLKIEKMSNNKKTSKTAETEALNIADVGNAKRTLNDFIKYLEGYGGEFNVSQLQDYAEAWLKSFNDC